MEHRGRAADDFDFIRKRLRELGDPPQIDALAGIDKRSTGEGGNTLTPAEKIAVAMAYKCTWVDSRAIGCGNPTSKRCLKANKCIAG